MSGINGIPTADYGGLYGTNNASFDPMAGAKQRHIPDGRRASHAAQMDEQRIQFLTLLESPDSNADEKTYARVMLRRLKIEWPEETELRLHGCLDDATHDLMTPVDRAAWFMENSTRLRTAIMDAERAVELWETEAQERIALRKKQEDALPDRKMTMGEAAAHVDALVAKLLLDLHSNADEPLEVQIAARAKFEQQPIAAVNVALGNVL